MLYTRKHKMAELMTQEPQVLFLISRFGVPFGVDEQTIEEVCSQQGIDIDTFLAIINFQLFHQPVELGKIHLDTLRTYLRNAHQYYLRYRLPALRHSLIEAMPSGDDHQVVLLILRFYDAFVQLVRRHIQQEENGAVKGHEKDNLHIAKKLSELKNLIIRYYPSEHSNEYGPYLVNALEMLQSTELELMAHCEIEDKILVPASLLHQEEATKEQKESTEQLSERETDVLVQIVNGYSNKQIADKLCLSIHTVISHRKNIVRKLGIHSTAGLTIYAVVNNLVALDDLKTKL